MQSDDRMERALDAALEMTFPASDAIAVETYAFRRNAAQVRADASAENAPRCISQGATAAAGRAGLSA